MYITSISRQVKLMWRWFIN